MLIHDQKPSISESKQLQNDFAYILLLEVLCTAIDSSRQHISLKCQNSWSAMGQHTIELTVNY